MGISGFRFCHPPMQIMNSPKFWLSYTVSTGVLAHMDNEHDKLSYIMLLFLLASAFVHGILTGLMAL